MRIFLSYHSADRLIALKLKAAIEARERASRVFFASQNLNGGAFWLPSIGEAIGGGTRLSCLLATVSAPGKSSSTTRHWIAGSTNPVSLSYLW